MPPHQGFAHANGTRLYYETAGSGKPLVLIHGNTLDTRMWDEQWDVFAARYRVIRYDMRGFGRSSMPAEADYSPAEDLKALLDYLDIDQAHVLGLSRGGAVALDYALMYPEKTLSLIFADAGLWDFPWTHYPASVKAVREAGRTSGIEAARAVWLDHPLFAPALEKPSVAGRLRAMITDYSGWHWQNDESLRLLDPPPIERLPTLKIPALVIVGERDLPDFRAIAVLLGEYVPGAEQIVLPGVGHLSNMEAPAVFNAAVLDFLSRAGAHQQGDQT